MFDIIVGKIKVKFPYASHDVASSATATRPSRAAFCEALRCDVTRQSACIQK